MRIKLTKRQVLMILCIIIMAVSLSYIAYYFFGTFRQRNLDSTVRSLYESLEPAPVQYTLPPTMKPADISLVINTDDEEWDENHSDNEDSIPWELTGTAIPVNFARFSPFLEINEDFVAMLLIPGLDMVLPVVQGLDNDKYLNNNFEGKKDVRGTVFMDFGNKINFTDRNSVLYGHYMQDGTMFHDLYKYKYIDNYIKAPLIEIDSLYGKSTWLIFAAYTSEPTFGYFHTRFWGEAYADLLNEIQRRSLYITDIDVNHYDKILTLSTCDYAFEDARFVVHARLLRPGETLPEVFNAEINADRQSYHIPNQLRFNQIPAENTAVYQHPQTNHIIYFQAGETGIIRYVGNVTYVQGPYKTYTGDINSKYFSWIAAGYGHPAKKEHYVISGGLNGNMPGLFLLRATFHTSAYRLVSKTPLTPEGVDARWPAVHTDHKGNVTLLYTVTDENETILYALPLGGEAEEILRVEAGLKLRPSGIVEDSELGTFLFWKEGNVLKCRMKTEEGFNRDVIINYPEEEGRLQIIYQRSLKRWITVTDNEGKIRAAAAELFDMIVFPEQNEVTTDELSGESGGENIN